MGHQLLCKPPAYRLPPEMVKYLVAALRQPGTWSTLLPHSASKR